MEQKDKLREQKDIMGSLETLTQAYEEISVMRMQESKSGVLSGREFITEIAQVFYQVKTSYKKQVEQLLKQKKQAIPFLGTGKSVVVLLTGNAKLYGDITQKVFNLFIENITSDTSDIVIVGKVGKDLFDQSPLKRGYTYIEIPDKQLRLEDLKPLISQILTYDKITVFHGQLINALDQNPVSSTISGEKPFGTQTLPSAQQVSFLFEPNLQKILVFFQTQIIAGLLKQTIHESELARHASRIRAMDEAHDRILEKLERLEFQKKKLKRFVMNKKQLEALSSLSLWMRKS